MQEPPCSSQECSALQQQPRAQHHPTTISAVPALHPPTAIGYALKCDSLSSAAHTTGHHTPMLANALEHVPSCDSPHQSSSIASGAPCGSCRAPCLASYSMYRSISSPCTDAFCAWQATRKSCSCTGLRSCSVKSRTANHRSHETSAPSKAEDRSYHTAVFGQCMMSHLQLHVSALPREQVLGMLPG